MIFSRRPSISDCLRSLSLLFTFYHIILYLRCLPSGCGTSCLLKNLENVFFHYICCPLILYSITSRLFLDIAPYNCCIWWHLCQATKLLYWYIHGPNLQKHCKLLQRCWKNIISRLNFGDTILYFNVSYFVFWGFFSYMILLTKYFVLHLFQRN